MNPSRHPLAGVYAAAVTPLTPQGEIDIEGLLTELSFLAGRGCHGALLFGTTGEGTSFSREEREQTLRAALHIKEQHPHFRLLAGVGTPSVTETIHLSKTAFSLGYDGVVSLPPFYYRKATDEGLHQWFTQVIQQSVPADGYLIGYHFPGVAGIGFSIPLLTRLKDQFPTQFAGIKDSSHDAELARQLGDLFGPELAVFNGTDSYFSLALQAQAQGCITAPGTLISPYLRAVWDAFESGQDTSTAQAQATHLRHVLEEFMPFPPTIKSLLHRVHNLPRWSTRAPLEALSPEAEERAVDAYTAALP